LSAISGSVKNKEQEQILRSNKNGAEKQLVLLEQDLADGPINPAQAAAGHRSVEKSHQT
jgi:hypothetical protein